ncbi:MAG: NPCBM/NEW2 domain-containing protein [Planctomycetota bacterium]|nr:NPCBM/NEW2 domain-containing protein [Planctomycetota bacterium]
MHASAWMISVGLLAIPLALVADDQSESRDQIELIDGESIEGRLVEFRRDVVLVDRRRVPVERIVRWDRFTSTRKKVGRRPPGTDEVLLVGGDRLRCRVETIDLEYVVARWDVLTRPTVFRVPLEHVRAVLFSSRTAARIGPRSDIDRGGRSADELLLRGGDRLVGELKSVGAEMVELKTAVGTRRVARQSVATLLVNPDLQVMVRRPTRHVRIAFSDGSRLTATGPISGENRLIGLEFSGLETVGAATAGKAHVDVPLPVIRSVQFFGDGILRLTTRTPERVVHTPFLGTVRPPVIDGSIGGGPLEVGGRWSASGLGMTSRTRMTWPLDGRHRWFCSRVAIDDTAGDSGDVVFRVLVDGRSAWSSGPVRGGRKPRIIGPVDLAGARKLTLVVEYGRRADVGDHAAWLDPRLVVE